MKASMGSISLNEDDLREMFSLFSSSTKFERAQVYDAQSDHHYAKVRLSEEYSLTQEKGEFAFDAWRAVISFLHSQGYCLSKEREVLTLSFIEDAFIP